MRTEWITIYTDERGKWRWRWKAANGIKVGASTQGYANLRDAITNLEFISGGRLDIDLRRQDWGYLDQHGRRTFVRVLR